MIGNLQLSSTVYLRIETEGPSILMTKVTHDKDNKNFVYTAVIRIPKPQLTNFVEQINQAIKEINE